MPLWQVCELKLPLWQFYCTNIQKHDISAKQNLVQILVSIVQFIGIGIVQFYWHCAILISNWYMLHVPCCMVLVSWSLFHVSCYLLHGPWSLFRGLWSMVRATYNFLHGLWCMVFGACQSVADLWFHGKLNLPKWQICADPYQFIRLWAKMIRAFNVQKPIFFTFSYYVRTRPGPKHMFHGHKSKKLATNGH